MGIQIVDESVGIMQIDEMLICCWETLDDVNGLNIINSLLNCGILKQTIRLEFDISKSIIKK